MRGSFRPCDLTLGSEEDESGQGVDSERLCEGLLIEPGHRVLCHVGDGEEDAAGKLVVALAVGVRDGAPARK